MYKFKFIDHPADIAVIIEADSLEELFRAAFESWREAVAEETPKSKKERTIILKESTAEELLVSFLSEINFLLQAKKQIANTLKEIQIEHVKDVLSLSAEIHILSLEEHSVHLKEEIKAITFSQLKIEQKGNLLSARLIFDI
jgi:SHS2 domain-containing protein